MRAMRAMRAMRWTLLTLSVLVVGCGKDAPPPAPAPAPVTVAEPPAPDVPPPPAPPAPRVSLRVDKDASYGFWLLWDHVVPEGTKVEWTRTRLEVDGQLVATLGADARGVFWWANDDKTHRIELEGIVDKAGGAEESVALGQLDVVADLAGPTWPEGATLALERAGEAVKVRWPAASDTSGVAAYSVYVNALDKSWRVEGRETRVALVDGATPKFHVSPVDAHDNYGEALRHVPEPKDLTATAFPALSGKLDKGFGTALMAVSVGEPRLETRRDDAEGDSLPRMRWSLRDADSGAERYHLQRGHAVYATLDPSISGVRWAGPLPKELRVVATLEGGKRLSADGSPKTLSERFEIGERRLDKGPR